MYGILCLFPELLQYSLSNPPPPPPPPPHYPSTLAQSVSFPRFFLGAIDRAACSGSIRWAQAFLKSGQTSWKRSWVSPFVDESSSSVSAHRASSVAPAGLALSVHHGWLSVLIHRTSPVSGLPCPSSSSHCTGSMKTARHKNLHKRHNLQCYLIWKSWWSNFSQFVFDKMWVFHYKHMGTMCKRSKYTHIAPHYEGDCEYRIPSTWNILLGFPFIHGVKGNNSWPSHAKSKRFVCPILFCILLSNTESRPLGHKATRKPSSKPFLSYVTR